VVAGLCAAAGERPAGGSRCGGGGGGGSRAILTPADSEREICCMQAILCPIEPRRRPITSSPCSQRQGWLALGVQFNQAGAVD
jgi:hypothetical protein